MTKNSLLALAFTALALPLHAAIPWDATDLGPFHTGCFKINGQVTAKGIAIKVGDKEHPATVLFDPELLRVSAAWTGGFIKFPGGRGGLEGQIAPGGDVKFSTPYLPGVSAAEIGDDPRDRHQGNLPADVAKYRGLYVHGDKVVLSYTIGKSAVLELPGAEVKDGALLLSRTIAVGVGPAVTVLLGAGGELAATVEGAGGAKVEKTADGKTVLRVPARQAATTFRVVVAAGAAQAPEASKVAVPDLVALCKGGPAHWGEALETPGKVGTGDGPYVVDEITPPENNPYKSWLRFGGHDFLPNGDVALVNIGGDVWHVSGLDDKLEHVKWQRIATGLFQPLGCKVVDGKIYVLGRDQITRLHDLNGDGEADFYENFNNDCVVTENYHEFALDLQTDSAGNFYYGKGSPWTPTNMSPHQGTMIRVSKDGSKLEPIANGLRAPNGLGMGPKDMLTCSDNQGHWMPANRLNIIKPGGFYGMTPAAHKTIKFKGPDGTEFEANPSSAADREKFHTEFWGDSKAPTPVAGYDEPLLWMPQNVDNSPGGEVWVSGGKWGPWEGRMLHMSYGHCLLYGVTMETVDGVAQGSVVKFPFKFSSGIMRGRFSPKDGQLYVSGLNVWQSDAAKFGCFARVRYTGATVTMPVELHAVKDGVQLTFTSPLDAASATDVQNYDIKRWNYKWTGNYGSPDFKVSDGSKGQDTMTVEKATLSPDKKTLTLQLADMRPAMTIRLKFKVQGADGKPCEQEIHSTVHRIPGVAAAK
ncbi:MAG: hypothetical protein K8R23_04400 [Chthoniobacter sp.]|nr:hypothetical protein [Chthoniobacter sp.]